MEGVRWVAWKPADVAIARSFTPSPTKTPRGGRPSPGGGEGRGRLQLLPYLRPGTEQAQLHVDQRSKPASASNSARCSALSFPVLEISPTAAVASTHTDTKALQDFRHDEDGRKVLQHGIRNDRARRRVADQEDRDPVVHGNLLEEEDGGALVIMLTVLLPEL